MITIDGIQFSKSEITQTIQKLSRSIDTWRTMVLEDHWTKDTCLNNIKVARNRIEQLTKLLSEV